MLMTVEEALGVPPLPTPPGFSLGSARYGAYYLYLDPYAYVEIKAYSALNSKLNRCIVVILQQLS